MRIEAFINKLADVHLESVFNPYTDKCHESDLQDGPEIRRKNLLTYMKAVEGNVKSIWFGRDLGYRGGRRTGLALTDEHHLNAFSNCYGGIAVSQATRGTPMSERTATVTWRMIDQLGAPPFLWNIFPFHPHERDKPMTNRCHTSAELNHCEPLIDMLMEWIQPTTVIAIGKDAYKGLVRSGYSCTYVRHPSYGGQSEFIQGISELYDISTRPTKQYDLLESSDR